MEKEGFLGKGQPHKKRQRELLRKNKENREFLFCKVLQFSIEKVTVVDS